MRYFNRCIAFSECDRHQHHLSDGTPINEAGQALDRDGQPITACIKLVSNGGRSVSSHNCGQKLKGDDRYPHLCGLHVAAIDRRKAKDAARMQNQETRGIELATAEKRVQTAADVLGISASAVTRVSATGPDAFIHVPTGAVLISLADLEKLARTQAGVVAKLRALKDRPDTEEAHREADGLLLQLLPPEICEAFGEIERWYA